MGEDDDQNNVSKNSDQGNSSVYTTVKYRVNHVVHSMHGHGIEGNVMSCQTSLYLYIVYLSALIGYCL